MENNNSHLEPKRHTSDCIYCGDAPVNHALFYILSLFSMGFDNHIIKVTKGVPEFFKRGIDRFIFFTFDTFRFLGLAKLSDDIELTNTFRSRVIWEEARRRGLDMKQLILFGSPIDQYRAKYKNHYEYFNSLPIPQDRLTMGKNWDDKFVLKNELIKNNIPVPKYVQFVTFLPYSVDKIFEKLHKPVIVKPRVGSRGRHTVTNIHNIEEFKNGVNVAKQICASLVAEEHIMGDVCRATLVDGKLMGFYRGGAPFVIGDGIKTVNELIAEKDRTRNERVEKVLVNEEMKNFVKRSGYDMDSVVPVDARLQLSYRTGRLFGGITREMLDELHPSFVPILERAGRVVGLPVIGFDCIVPDPTKDADSQKWAIIECNTLPFIDLHYYALLGKPKNIAGAIWDIWTSEQ